MVQSFFVVYTPCQNALEAPFDKWFIMCIHDVNYAEPRPTSLDLVYPRSPYFVYVSFRLAPSSLVKPYLSTIILVYPRSSLFVHVILHWAPSSPVWPYVYPRSLLFVHVWRTWVNAYPQQPRWIMFIHVHSCSSTLAYADPQPNPAGSCLSTFTLVRPR